MKLKEGVTYRADYQRSELEVVAQMQSRAERLTLRWHFCY